MSAKKDETTLSEGDIYDEHQKAVNPMGHWAYLFAVLIGGTVVMLVFVAILGST